MALSNNSNSSNKPLKVLTLRTIDKDKKPIDKPFWEVSEKIDNAWKVTGRFTQFSGNLTRVFPKVKEFKRGEEVIDSKEVVDLFFEDNDEAYMVSLTYKVATRRLFNALLNLTSFDDIEISVSRGRDGWENLWLKQYGTNVKGKYTKEQIPPVIEAQIGKKVVRSYDNSNEFFKLELEKLEKVVSQAPKSPTVAKVEPQEVEEEEDEENIPF